MLDRGPMMTNSTPVIRLSPNSELSMTPAQALSSPLADAEGDADVLIVAYDEDGCLYQVQQDDVPAKAFSIGRNKAMAIRR